MKHLNEQGFTLIELLVVVAIVGILAAIAIPQFAEFKIRAYNTEALSIVRNVITSQEAYFVDWSTYTNNFEDLPGYSTTDNVTVAITSANDTSWAGNAYHNSGSLTYCYNSTSLSNIPSVSGTGSACP